ncbi:hypothetical protein HAX54_029146 [Datura stramonium]|uniref:Uncharacterized protein n=1 Tax=Datura stramonium TaxID=4076 RepID=A0ABS8V5S6_DATST|nr:hypothetical protein [Datura stramonium]
MELITKHYSGDVGSDSEDESGNEEGLTAIVRGHLKRRIFKKVRIIDQESSEYPNIERWYHFYGLNWMSETPSSYYLNMVREFYANYVAILDSLCKNRQKAIDMTLQLRIPVHGKMVDISVATTNRMLYGPDFIPPDRTTEFDYKMSGWHN